MLNQSTHDKHWTVDGYTYTEVIRQAYANCSFAAGFVEGHPVDTLYVELVRDGKTDVFLLLRPDEAAALAWVLSGALWSKLIE